MERSFPLFYYGGAVKLGRTDALRERLFARYDPDAAVADWERLFAEVL